MRADSGAFRATTDDIYILLYITDVPVPRGIYFSYEMGPERVKRNAYKHVSSEGESAATTGATLS